MKNRTPTYFKYKRGLSFIPCAVPQGKRKGQLLELELQSIAEDRESLSSIGYNLY